MDGVPLTFHLAGINNQNFLMRDQETGTYWQQISGKAVSGPLRGKQLELVHSDELLFSTWRSEEPAGTVLNDVAADKGDYSPADWDKKMKRAPTVIRHARAGVAQRDIMLGVQDGNAARAFPYETALREKLINDRIGDHKIVLVTAADNASVRSFRVSDAAQEFYRVTDGAAVMMDSGTGSKWNFQGCAIEGPAKGTCLPPVHMLKDYWFDWREYHPNTTVFHKQY